MRNWDNTITGLRKEPDVALLETLFLRQIRKCTCLAHSLARYDYAKGLTTETGEVHQDSTYRFLYKTVKMYLSQKLDGSQRAEELGAMADGRTGSLAAAPVGRAQESAGRATRTAKGSAPGGGKTPKGSSKGTPKTAEEKAVTPCSFFANGYCKKGEDCDWSHADTNGHTPRPVAAAVKAKAKAAKASAPAAPLLIRAAIAAASLMAQASSLSFGERVSQSSQDNGAGILKWLCLDDSTDVSGESEE